MNRKIVSYYSIIIGFAVILMWTMILLKKEIPEGKTELLYHLSSEFLMAVLCLISGILWLSNRRIGKSLNILGLGMVIYSVLNAAGYYGERDNIPMMVMFSILFILTIIAVILNLSAK
jgi:lipopolysaccharide export LptBFGC system permease protein LptF